MCVLKDILCCISVLLSALVVEGASLFKEYPILKNKLAHVSLCTLPTPIQLCEQLSEILGAKIYVKADNCSAGINEFGGNKVRKLEFLLGDALQNGATEILTYGCFGSNHAVATSWWAHKLGLDCSCILFPQPYNAVVLRNILLHVALRTKLYCAYSSEQKKQIEQQILNFNQQSEKASVYLVPVGGSTPLGAVGYVNAAFEVYEQYKALNQPLPEAIIVPAGSCGTAVGLAVGLRLLNYQGRLVLVAVQNGGGHKAFVNKLTELAQATNELLHAADNSIPLFDWKQYEWILLDEYVGEGYAKSTAGSNYAQQLFKAVQGLVLDPVYTAKAAAGMFGYLEQHPEINSVLFFNTFCADQFERLIHQAYLKLPRSIVRLIVPDNGIIA